MKDQEYQARSAIILPPDSTSADLQAAIDGAASGDTIIISGDMPFTNTVSVPEGKEITVQSDDGNNWIMSVPGSYVRHFEVIGGLILQGITIDGEGIGGGVYLNGGVLTVNEDAIIQNCYSNNPSGGGGVFGDNYCSFTMNSGVISYNNSEPDIGAGVCLRPGDFTMTGGSISENQGGGVYCELSNSKMTGGKINGNTAGIGGGLNLYSTDFIMEGGEISENTAASGGGVHVTYGSTFTIKGGGIINNTATWEGGGIFLYDKEFIMTGGRISGNVITDGQGGGIFTHSCVIEISGESYITNNSAPKGDSGGIFTHSYNYNNLNISDTVVFGCNSASTAYAPPPDAGVLYPNIQFASTSITNHPLNNFDIYHTDGEPIEERFHVTYNANGGSGGYIGPETEPGGTDTVLSLSDTGISRSGYTFTDWNTEPDGSGAAYSPGSTIILECSAVLFAQWVVDPGFITVTYNSNGGTGSHVDTPRYFDDYTVLSASEAEISRPGFIFTGWNTQPDGSGESFAPGDRIAISENVSLYAQWRQIPIPKKQCRAPAMKCRTTVEGQKIWVDNDNAGDTRPPSVEIILLRDGEEYKRTNVDSAGDGYFGFCCLPKWKNSGHKYNYQIDEIVPDGYTKAVEGYTVINTLNP